MPQEDLIEAAARIRAHVKEVFDAAHDITSITTGAADVDAAFEALSKLDSATYKKVVDRVEEAAVWKVRGTRGSFGLLELVATSDAYRTGVMNRLRDSLGVEASARERQKDEARREEWKEEMKEHIAREQSLCQVLLHLSEIKGDEAHPIVRDAVKNISALSDSEYNDVLKLDKAIIAAVEKHAPKKKEPVPRDSNPFKNKGPRR